MRPFINSEYQKKIYDIAEFYGLDVNAKMKGNNKTTNLVFIIYKIIDNMHARIKNDAQLLKSNDYADDLVEKLLSGELLTIEDLKNPAVIHRTTEQEQADEIFLEFINQKISSGNLLITQSLLNKTKANNGFGFNRQKAKRLIEKFETEINKFNER